MPLFGKGDEGAKLFKKARRYSDPSKQEFDLDTAIRYLEGALDMSPHKEQYRRELDRIRELKLKWDETFSVDLSDEISMERFFMKVEDVFTIGGRLTVVTGRVERGIIRVGDEVLIGGLKGMRRARVDKIEAFRRELTHAIAGQSVGILLTVETKDGVKGGVERGDVLEAI